MMKFALSALLMIATPLAAQDIRSPNQMTTPLGPSLTGEARMGFVWSRPPDWAQGRETGLRLTHRARLTLNFTTETDQGLTLGAQIRLDRDMSRQSGGN